MSMLNGKGRAVWLGLILLAALFGVTGCGGPSDPISAIRQTMGAVPTYSIVLYDMKEEGNFFTSYFHQYQIVTPEKAETTGWLEVPRKTYEKFLPFLGMTVYTQQDGKGAEQYGPPGYAYVGNSQYGQWRTDSSGRSFWEFYGQYALLSHLLGGGPIYRTHWQDYQQYSSQHRPYFGDAKQYGTAGSYTKTQRPDFFARRVAAERAKSSSFSQKVNDRVGRTKVTTRSRSSSGGK